MRMRMNSATLVAFAVATAACSSGSDPGDDLADLAGSAPTTEAPVGSTTTEVPGTTSPPTAATTAPTTTEAPIPEVVVTVAGEEEVVFDYSEANCEGLARPDLSVRATRTGDEISMTLAHTSNYRLVGNTFDSLVLSCDPVLRSSYDHDPAVHAHHEWLAATYVDGDGTVHGVVHNEFHGYESELADSRRALLTFEDPGDWKYLARTAAGSATPMTPAASGFGADGLCTVDFWGAHPDVDCEAVSRWTSDRDGGLVIDVETTKVGVGGDGVTIDVRIDGAVVWQAELSDGEPSASVRLTESVRTGSTIDVGVATNGTSSFDATEIRTVITPDGVRCTADIRSCSRVELTAVRSDDGGATFVPTSEARDLVASPPGRYEHDVGFSAMWQPSNIVAHPDGSHVMIVQFDDARDGGAQYSCLLRTEDLADPTAWRAWNGTAFSLPAVDPYVTADVAPACAPIAPAPISGLTWHPELELFIAVGGFAQFGQDGQYALVSPDLFSWSQPIFIQPAAFVFNSDTPPFEPYATLIDHASAAASFDTIGNTPHLYFTRINDPITLDFDVVRVPLEISIAGD